MNSTLRIANVNVSDEGGLLFTLRLFSFLKFCFTKFIGLITLSVQGVYTCSFSNSDITGSIYHDYATISLTVEVTKII